MVNHMGCKIMATLEKNLFSTIVLAPLARLWHRVRTSIVVNRWVILVVAFLAAAFLFTGGLVVIMAGFAGLIAGIMLNRHFKSGNPVRDLENVFGFSRSAAEVLMAFTGSDRLYDGFTRSNEDIDNDGELDLLGEYIIRAGSSLVENGPAVDIALRWNTLIDAAD